MVLIISTKLFLMSPSLAVTHGAVELAKDIICQRLPLSIYLMENAWRQIKRVGGDHCLQTCCPRGQLTRWINSIMDTRPELTTEPLKSLRNKIVAKNQKSNHMIRLKFVCLKDQLKKVCVYLCVCCLFYIMHSLADKVTSPANTSLNDNTIVTSAVPVTPSRQELLTGK